jgi:nitrite reductase (NADH) large subunit
VEVSTALCEHFALSRADLYEVVAATGLTAFSSIISAHGRERGCDVCKPAIASMLATLASQEGRPSHVLDGEQATLQDTNDHFLANMQRNGTYSVVPRLPGGEVSGEGLIAIGEIARDFGLYTKITGGSGSTCSVPGWSSCRRSGGGSSTPGSSPGTRTARRCGR